MGTKRGKHASDQKRVYGRERCSRYLIQSKPMALGNRTTDAAYFLAELPRVKELPGLEHHHEHESRRERRNEDLEQEPTRRSPPGLT